MKRFILMALVIFFGTASLAHAQEPYKAPEGALPIEIAMLHSKLLKKDPNYDALIYLNPAISSDPEKFGTAAVIKEQRDALEKIYFDTKPDKIIYAQIKTVFLGVAPDGTLMLEKQDPDQPIVYSLFDQQNFGVFMRNLKDIENLRPPFEIYNQSPPGKGREITLEVTLLPVAADDEHIQIADGMFLKPIIADVVEIKLLTHGGRMVSLQKRLNGWQPEPAAISTSPLFQPDLLDSLSKQK